MRSRLAIFALLQAAGGCNTLQSDGLQPQAASPLAGDAGMSADANIPDRPVSYLFVLPDGGLPCGEGVVSAPLRHLFASDVSADGPVPIGCSDGSREGFLSASVWPKIAGCAGAWDQRFAPDAGLSAWTCGGQAGDTGGKPDGRGCAMADLCDVGWHVCTNGYDVETHSTTGSCEGMLPSDEVGFFIVATGASPQGVCYPNQEGINDLHGCGNLGAPETVTCSPLTRRMGFADCMATCNVWHCGDETQSLGEAQVVTKSSPQLGGVLCCKD